LQLASVADGRVAGFFGGDIVNVSPAHDSGSGGAVGELEVPALDGFGDRQSALMDQIATVGLAEGAKEPVGFDADGDSNQSA
jgi:hypothetical protein